MRKRRRTGIAPSLWCDRRDPPPAESLDLARLKGLEDPELPAAQKANLGRRLYRDEMVHPRPRPAPPYTDYKTHDYVLAEITRKLAAGGADAATLKKTWQTMKPGDVKDS